MKLSALIACLNRRLNTHGDVEVQVTWEGIVREIAPANIYLERGSKLLIDADGNDYKRNFAADPTEGENE